MTISQFSTIPHRGDSAEVFNAAADAFMAGIPQLVNELNAMGTAFNLATTTTSSTSNTVAVGSKTFTVAAGLGFMLGMPLTMASTASPLNNMYGTVTAYSGVTLTVQASAVNGTGTFTAWSISLAAASIGAGLGTNTFNGVQNWNQGTDIASATTINLTASIGNLIAITGTTGISSITLGNGMFRVVVFTGACLLTYNSASLQLNTGGANYTTVADDRAIIFALNGITYVNLLPISGKSITPQVISNKIETIGATVAASALTLTLNPTTLDFRSSALTSGAINTRTIASALSLTVPSTVTLGTTNALASRLALLAIDVGGTIELATTNIASGTDLSETGLVTTNAIATTCTFTGSIAASTGILTLSATGTGTLALGMALSGTNISSGTYVQSLLTGTLGSAGSTYKTNQLTVAASTTISSCAGMGIYSTTARSSVPYRFVGYIENTQAIAGTWATAPSTIQGAGGNALSSMSSLGYGQTWNNVVGSRVAGTTYYNTTGKPILVTILPTFSSSQSVSGNLSVNGVVAASFVCFVAATIPPAYPLTAIIPPGASYLLTLSTATLSTWNELR